MTKKVVVFLFTLALLVLSGGKTVAQIQKNRFSPLVSSYESDDVVFIARSEVAPTQATQETLDRFSKLSKRLIGLEESKDFYRYIYRFENAGKKRIKVLFSGQEFLFSPITYFLQDFVVELNPGEIKEVKFIANGRPEFEETFASAAVWGIPFGENFGEKWLFRGIGKFSFWKASFNSHHEEIK